MPVLEHGKSVRLRLLSDRTVVRRMLNPYFSEDPRARCGRSVFFHMPPGGSPDAPGSAVLSRPGAPFVVAQTWYGRGMARVRVSTTVDEGLLASARRLRSELPDSALIDEALASLLARHRKVEIDAAYSAYDQHPLDEADAWGDLASFRAAAGAS